MKVDWSIIAISCIVDGWIREAEEEGFFVNLITFFPFPDILFP